MTPHYVHHDTFFWALQWRCALHPMIDARPRARWCAAQQAEAAIGVAVLNSMLTAGHPNSLRHQKITAARPLVEGLSLLALKCANAKLKLTGNNDKTYLCQLPQERFDVLGYTFGRCYKRDTGRALSALGHQKKTSNPLWTASPGRRIVTEPYWMPKWSWDSQTGN